MKIQAEKLYRIEMFIYEDNCFIWFAYINTHRVHRGIDRITQFRLIEYYDRKFKRHFTEHYNDNCKSIVLRWYI